MRAGTMNWATSCSLRSRAGPPPMCEVSGGACPTVSLRTSETSQRSPFAPLMVTGNDPPTQVNSFPIG